VPGHHEVDRQQGVGGTDGRIAPRRPGRPATASRADVVRCAREQYLSGQRVDLTLVASRLGLGRATIYRWFGSRDELLGEILATELERLIARHRAQVRHRGARGLLEVFDRINRSLSRAEALRTLVERERDSALRLLTSSGGRVQPRAVARVQELIEAEVATGAYDPPTDPGALAYAIVRLAEAFLYNDVAIGIRGDWQQLHQVEAALLGVRPSDGRDARPSQAATGRRLPGASSQTQTGSGSRPGSRSATPASRRSARRRRSPAAG
jgi:AcrR family transcriptional regulator